MARMGRLGWFLGLIFGTIFGVLFAPRKGKDLRAAMKADRKKGKLGIAPLRGDLRHLGEEIIEIAKDIYASPEVREVIVKGRKKVKELSDDLIGEVADFRVTRIAPFEKQAKNKIKQGEKTFRKAKSELKTLKHKAKSSLSIGKRALKEIKRVIRKK